MPKDHTSDLKSPVKKYISLTCEIALLQKLRRNVVGRSAELGLHVFFPRQDLREAEVDQPDLPVGADEDVVHFDVLVQDALFVAMGQMPANRQKEFPFLLDLQISLPESACATERNELFSKYLRSVVEPS